MKKIYIKTISGQISDYVSVFLLWDADGGMKYQVSDTRIETEVPPRSLRIEVPAAIRRELLRRAIPSINGITGNLLQNCQISQQLENFVFECWRIILSEQEIITILSEQEIG